MNTEPGQRAAAEENERMDEKLRLFVWDNYAPDYTTGLAFAIAPNIQEAIVIKEEA